MQLYINSGLVQTKGLGCQQGPCYQTRVFYRCQFQGWHRDFSFELLTQHRLPPDELQSLLTTCNKEFKEELLRIPDPGGSLSQIERDISVTWWPDITRIGNRNTDLQSELIFFNSKTHSTEPVA